jgi:hypothetical protein
MKRPIRRGMRIGIATLGVAMVVPFMGATKDEFKKAAGANSGCYLIPYSAIYDRCRDNYPKQTEWCTGAKEAGCRGMNKSDPKDRELAKERRDNAAKCIEYRNYQTGIFEDSVNELKKESSNPDQEIKAMAEIILNKTVASIEQHKDATKQVENRRDTCDEIYNNR